MIIGIGTDIVNIERIKQMWDQYGERFISRILSPDEIKIFNGHQNNIAFLAKRFAAKEAVAKAFGTGIGQNMAFTEISITNSAQGKPEVTLLGKAKAYQQQIGCERIQISLADERDYALAFVVIEQ